MDLSDSSMKLDQEFPEQIESLNSANKIPLDKKISTSRSILSRNKSKGRESSVSLDLKEPLENSSFFKKNLKIPIKCKVEAIEEEKF